MKTGLLVRELFKRGLIFGYSYDEDYIDGFVLDGSLAPTENFVQNAEWLGKIEIKPEKGGIMGWMASAANTFSGLFGGENATVEEDGTVDLGDQNGGFEYHGFFLGDLMYVAMDCLYKDGTATHHEWARNLNMRFLMTSVSVPDPNDLSKTKNISPLAIPIDLKFFTSWFHQKYVKKELTSYPVGTFIRDLIERLVNDIIYEACFASLSIGEKPPQMRVGFFTDHDKSWFQTGKGSFFNPGNPDILMKSKVNLTVEDARNYCTIYQDQPSLLNLQKAQKEKRLKDDDYVLSYTMELTGKPLTL